MDPIRTFRNVRARVLWAEEGRWHAGWTKHLAHDEVRIRLKRSVSLPSGCRMIGECYGDGTLVRFTGFLQGQVEQDVAIRVCGALGAERSHENVRFGVEGVSGTLSDPTTRRTILVTDVSPEGLGAVAERPVRAGAMLDLAVDSNDGIGARVCVVYCRPEPGPEERHRIGLRLVDASRLDVVRWERFLTGMTRT